MGIKTGITTEKGLTPKVILVAPENAVALGVFCNNNGVNAVNNANSAYNGKNMIFAGTPITGSFEDRGNAFAVATTTNNVSDAIGVALCDMDVTAGDANGEVLVQGIVNLGKLESDVANLITTDVKSALAGRITFVK
jgi:hypothetical protein